MRMNPTRKITRLIFGKLLAEAWGKSATANNAINGFLATGIIPLNPNAIPDYAYLTDYVQPQTEREARVEMNSPQPGCSSWFEKEQSRTDVANSTSGPLANPSNDDITPGKILDQISPVPQLSQVEKARKNSRNLASVLNTESNIQTLKEKQLQKHNKKEEQKNAVKKENKQTSIKPKKKKQIVNDSTSEEESEPELEDEEEIIEEDNNYCAGCGEEYIATTKDVDWIQCVRCKRWLHEDCTKYGNSCDLCGKFLQNMKN